jgi:hypothetical protein
LYRTLLNDEPSEIRISDYGRKSNRHINHSQPSHYPDAEPDAPILGQLGLALGHRALDFGPASDRIDDARELGQVRQLPAAAG